MFKFQNPRWYVDFCRLRDASNLGRRMAAVLCFLKFASFGKNKKCSGFKILGGLRVLGYPNPGQSFGRGMCGPEATGVKL